mmetsp:Transcript_126/g.314  ORF Transcript_126/g.314 Transcript_126/m.314 type:complete len:220 (-) Transcript_126:544-1203(-)
MMDQRKLVTVKTSRRSLGLQKINSTLCKRNVRMIKMMILLRPRHPRHRPNLQTRMLQQTKKKQNRPPLIRRLLLLLVPPMTVIHPTMMRETKQLMPPTFVHVANVEKGEEIVGKMQLMKKKKKVLPKLKSMNSRMMYLTKLLKQRMKTTTKLHLQKRLSKRMINDAASDASLSLITQSVKNTPEKSYISNPNLEHSSISDLTLTHFVIFLVFLMNMPRM